MKITQRIAQYINEQEVNQKQFADSAGISRQMLSNWMRKDQIPSPESFKRVLKAMTKLPKKEREELKKAHSLAWQGASGRKRIRDSQKTTLYAHDRIAKLYRVSYEASVWLRDIEDPSYIPEMEKQELTELARIRLLGKLKEDRRLIQQLGMKKGEQLLESFGSIYLSPLQRELPGFEWSLWIRLSADTLKSEKTPIYFSIKHGGRSIAVKQDTEFIMAIRAIATALKIQPRDVSTALQEIVIKKLRDALATVDAKREEKDAFIVPRKLGTRVLSILSSVTDLEEGMLQWQQAQVVAFLVKTREVTRDFLLTYVKNDAEHELAQLLFDHLIKPFPKL
jgi:transcriptional regulator with XRE-family HTH domain